MLALLGYDSFSHELVGQMLDEGRLPTLAGLRERGSWHDLEIPRSRLGTHQTLYTGADVGEHGLYHVFQWSPSDQRVRFVQDFSPLPAVWERSNGRKRSLIVDPYESWRPRALHGVGVSGVQFGHTFVLPRWSVPGRTRRMLLRRLGRPPVVDEIAGTPTVRWLLRLRERLLESPDRLAQAVPRLLAEDRFDLVWVTMAAGHVAGHLMWDLSQVREQVSPEAARVLESGVKDVYEAVDRAMGQILRALPDDADVIAISPLGMGPQTSRTDLLPDMLQAVLDPEPSARREPPGPRSGLLWRARSALPSGMRAGITGSLPNRLVTELTARLYYKNVDWSRTRAFPVPADHDGYIRLNLRGRERDGIVAPDEVEALVAQISEGFLSFRDPDGTPVVVSVEHTAGLASGPRADRLPDLIVRWTPRPTGKVDSVRSDTFGEIRRRFPSGRSGNHELKGWAVIASANGPVRDLGRPLRVADVTATAAAALDVDTAGIGGEPLVEPRS